MEPLDYWDRSLVDWAIPDEILAAAPESPYAFRVGLFDRLAEEALDKDTPSRRRALEALPPAGTVLDVGCGGGAASLSLAPWIGKAIGVDEQERMLKAFAARAERLGIAHEEVRGRWPDVADEAPEADVVVCRNVLYNVAALAPFAQALTVHARGRVVVEVTGEHPLAWLGPLWRRFWDLDRPSGPTGDDALAALCALGLDAKMERYEEPSPWQDLDEFVTFARTCLCLPASRDPDIRAALPDLGLPRPHRSLATLWW
ncbi:MAG: class I SAM-dependent methyltransferase [Egibacteraceae bacterium]